MKENKLITIRLVIFLSIASIFLIIFSFLYAQARNSNYLVLLMFTPMLSVIITRFITKEGFNQTFIQPLIKHHKKYYLLSYFLTPVIAFSGALLYFILFPSQINLLASKFAIQNHIHSIQSYFNYLILIMPLCILINPIGGILSSLGEEFAWRGYLLPKLSAKYSTKKAIFLTGIIWGIWHAPIIFMGFNYGTEHPVWGIIMMIIFCSVINLILSSLFLKTHTIWVPVVAHASLNAIDQYTPSYLFTALHSHPNFFLGPNLIGLIGGFGFIVTAIYCYNALFNSKSKR